MLKKIIFTVSFIFISFYGNAQKDVNNYKYVIVPKEFDFTKGEDQYLLNSLTKFLFNKYGYQAFFTDDDFPDDLKDDGCLGLISEVVNAKGGIFKTKLQIVLKDCYGTDVMKSQIGESRLKEYEKAYNEALRDAFKTFQNIDYQYVLDETKIKEKKVIVAQPERNAKIEVENPQEKVANNTPLKKQIKGKKQEVKKSSNDIYYAQAIDNGFQLVNSESRIVIVLLRTAAEYVFIVKDKSAIVFKEDGFWYYSENDGEHREKQQLNIKF